MTVDCLQSWTTRGTINKASKGKGNNKIMKKGHKKRGKEVQDSVDIKTKK